MEIPFSASGSESYNGSREIAHYRAASPGRASSARPVVKLLFEFPVRLLLCVMAVPGASRSVAHGVLSADTSPVVERLQIDAWQRMSSVDKARTVNALTRDTQALALAGIRRRHPGASERECFLRLAVLKLGRETTIRLYPDAAELLES